LFHAGTGVSGSGPAYLFLAAAGMAEGGAQAGLDYDVALRLACETMIGAGAMLKRSDQEPDALRVAVTSPGGTTEAALGELGRYSFREGLVSAVAAAAGRSKTLASRD
jgi:pyrroline-5-carboxylate reductase